VGIWPPHPRQAHTGLLAPPRLGVEQNSKMLYHKSTPPTWWTSKPYVCLPIARYHLIAISYLTSAISHFLKPTVHAADKAPIQPGHSRLGSNTNLAKRILNEPASSSRRRIQIHPKDTTRDATEIQPAGRPNRT